MAALEQHIYVFSSNVLNYIRGDTSTVLWLVTCIEENLQFLTEQQRETEVHIENKYNRESMSIGTALEATPQNTYPLHHAGKETPTI